MSIPNYALHCTLFDVKNCTTCASQCEVQELPLSCGGWQPRQNVRFEYSPPCWRGVVRRPEIEKIVPEGCWICPCLLWRHEDGLYACREGQCALRGTRHCAGCDDAIRRALELWRSGQVANGVINGFADMTAGASGRWPRIVERWRDTPKRREA